MTVIALPPPKRQEHYTMAAFDGADDDGGTLYVLYDESGRQITGSAWPQPLEAIAKLAGFSVRVSSYAPSDRSDCEVPGGRRPKLTLASHLMQQLPDDDD